MLKRADRNAHSALGDRYIDTRCVDCGAALLVVTGLILRHWGKSVFARPPATGEERIADWRAVLVFRQPRSVPKHRSPNLQEFHKAPPEVVDLEARRVTPHGVVAIFISLRAERVRMSGRLARF